MALTIEVTQKEVRDKGERFNHDYYSIMAHLLVFDDGGEVINKEFSIDHKTINPLSDGSTELQELMDEEIAKYKAEKAIKDLMVIEAEKIQTSLNDKEK